MEAATQQQYKLRLASPTDAVALAEFAARTFADTFAAANRPEDMAVYLPSAYSPDLQRAEIEDPKITTLLLEQADRGVLVAYAMLRSGDVPAAVSDKSAVELWRFYVDRPWHGLGLAQRLMTAAQEQAVQRGAHTMWLGVWEKNPRAIAFYEKCGFRDVGAHDFWVGADRQTDRIMVMEVAAK
jgi:ribosomal protein S18 acetylase RimI-like enzyme